MIRKSGLRFCDKDHAPTKKGQYHDEERQPAACIAYRDRPVSAPIDLRALAGSEVELQIDRPLGRPDAADVIPHDRHTALVALLAQTLENLLSAIGMGVQKPRDARLEGIKGTAARRRRMAPV